jgi:hypothetical protein
MATTTTNYGFDVPTSSDLVKNGATAIATLGQDIDTFLAGGMAFASGKNKVLNSDFSIWQRGTTITAGNAVYAADRWLTFTDAATGRTLSQQTTGDTTNLPFIRYCARYQRANGNTSTGRLVLGQGFETTTSMPYSGKTVTLSFYARAGANFSSASSALSVTIQNGTGTDQNIFAGYTGNNNIVTESKTLTTTWQRFTVTGAVPSDSTELGFQMGYTPVGTAGAADYYEVTGVQLEVGSQATPFQTATGTLQGELAACQRYYHRTVAQSSYGQYGFAVGTSTTTAAAAYQFPSTMRVPPTSVDFSNIAVYPPTGGTIAITAFTVGDSTTASAIPAITVASGLTTGTMYRLGANNNSSAFIGFGAEL